MFIHIYLYIDQTKEHIKYKLSVVCQIYMYIYAFIQCINYCFWLLVHSSYRKMSVEYQFSIDFLSDVVDLTFDGIFDMKTVRPNCLCHIFSFSSIYHNFVTFF